MRKNYTIHPDDIKIVQCYNIQEMAQQLNHTDIKELHLSYADIYHNKIGELAIVEPNGKYFILVREFEQGLVHPIQEAKSVSDDIFLIRVGTLPREIAKMVDTDIMPDNIFHDALNKQFENSGYKLSELANANNILIEKQMKFYFYHLNKVYANKHRTNQSEIDRTEYLKKFETNAKSM